MTVSAAYTSRGFYDVKWFQVSAQFLEEPRLARLHTYILREGDVTIDEIVTDIDMPRTTAYADTGSLIDLGVLTRDEKQKRTPTQPSRSRSL